MELTPLHHLAIAFGLGLLVGLQREWADKPVAGIRTFPLITVFGALTGILARHLGTGWPIAAGMLALGGILVVGTVASWRKGERHGTTTEVSALVMFAVGAVLATGFVEAALAVAGAVMVLLQLKKPLHEFAGRVAEADLRAVLRLVIIALVILPVLPDRAYGPFGVLNPFRIWLMVVLIVGISLGAYVAQRLLGGRVSTVLAGVLGGLISSTATTVSYSRRSKKDPDTAAAAAFVIIAASTVVFVRVLLEIVVLAPSMLDQVAPPLLAVMAFMVALCVVTFLRFQRRIEGADLTATDPTNLGAAIFFGVLYAVVLFGVAAAKERFGSSGVFAVAAVSGLTDIDAITISTAELMRTGQIGPAQGWQVILVGVLANLVFKGALALLLGGLVLFRRIAAVFGLAIAAGAAVLWLW